MNRQHSIIARGNKGKRVQALSRHWRTASALGVALPLATSKMGRRLPANNRSSSCCSSGSWSYTARTAVTTVRDASAQCKRHSKPGLALQVRGGGWGCSPDTRVAGPSCWSTHTTCTNRPGDGKMTRSRSSSCCTTHNPRCTGTRGRDPTCSRTRSCGSLPVRTCAGSRRSSCRTCVGRTSQHGKHQVIRRVISVLWPDRAESLHQRGKVVGGRH